MSENRVKLSNNLYLDEYIPKEVYYANKDRQSRYFGWNDQAYQDLLIRKINPALIISDQKLRDMFGPVTLNDWWHGGRFNHRGVRFYGFSDGGKMPATGSATINDVKKWSLSDHFFGDASDKVFQNYTAEEIRSDIFKNWRTYGITIIEADTAWLHTSVAWVMDQKDLKIVPIPK